MQALITFMMHGRVQAIGSIVTLAILSWLISPLVIFTTAGVALVTLVHGYREGVLVTIAATGLLAAFAAITLGNINVGLELATRFWIPALLLAVLLARWNAVSWVMVAAATAAVILLLGFYLMGEPAVFWYKVITEQLVPILKNAGIPVQQDAQSEKAWRFMASIMTGSVLSLFLGLQLTSLLVARWWQAMLYNPQGFAREFRQLRYGKLVALVVAVVVMVAVTTSNELALNLFFIAVVLMLFQGLAVAHALVANCKLNPVLLFMLYLFMLLTLPQGALGILLVAMVGLVDNGLNLRLRFCAQAQDGLN